MLNCLGKPSTERERYGNDLAKRLFGGEVREVADEEGAIRVADKLGIAQGVICKRGKELWGGK